MSLNAILKETMQKELQGEKDDNYNYRDLYKSRLVDLRKKFRAGKTSMLRVERPSNLARAKSLGYAAKEGIIVVAVKVRKGAGLFRRPKRGRRPKRMGIAKLTRRISIQSIAEQRVSKSYPNCEVINSYFIGEDGTQKFFEVILYDVAHPSIRNDKKRNWIVESQHTRRAERGLTSSGKKSRGMRTNRGKGFGTEKARPSLRSHDRQLK